LNADTQSRTGCGNIHDSASGALQVDSAAESASGFGTARGRRYRATSFSLAAISPQLERARWYHCIDVRKFLAVKIIYTLRQRVALFRIRYRKTARVLQCGTE
jgi:hypothetical protein